MPLVAKFTIIFTIIFLSIAGVFYVAINYAEENFKTQITDDLTIIAEVEEGYILTFLEQVKGRVVDFSTDGLIRNLTSQIVNAKTPPPDIVSELNVHLRKNKQNIDKTIMGILITDLEGNVVSSTNETEIGRNESDDPYFQQIINANLNYGFAHITDIFESYHFNTTSPVFFVAAPLFSVDKQKRLGYILNQISLDELSKILDGTKQLELGAISGFRGRRTTFDSFLVNKDEFLITPSRQPNEGILKQKISTLPVLSCKERKEISAIYENFRGAEVIGAAMCLPVHGWALVTQLSTDEAFAAINNLKEELFISGVLFLIVILIFITLFSYFIVIRPISRLKQGAEIIGSGNLNHEIKIKSKDEFGRLAGDFNIMALHLKQLFGEVKSSAEKIRESEVKYKIMFDGAPDAILISDIDGDFLEANEAAQILIGCKPGELAQMSHVQIYAKENMVSHLEHFREAIQRGQYFESEARIAKKDGNIFPADVSLNLFKYGDKKYVQFMIRDVSERAAVEKHHKEVDYLKTQFINVVSHQLRTPLNSIRWSLEILLGKDLGKLKKEQEKFLKTIYINNQNIINIISDVFLALEIEEAVVVLEKEILEIGSLIDDVIKNFKNELAIKHLKLKFKKDGEYKVEADQGKLSQVFARLIDNAVKYSKDGGEITVKIEKVDGQAVISVADEGVGIPLSEQKSIFSKFFRASNAAVMHQNASGLGLFISQKLLQSHGGKIWFDSKEGKETTFFVSLPLMK